MRHYRSSSRWVVIALGVFALVMGTVGLFDPARQAAMMGFSGTETATLMAITSLATINTAAVYIVGALKRWPAFPAWAVGARTLMGIGLMTLALEGKGPSPFFGAATWEWLGAAFIGASAWWDRRSETRAQPGSAPMSS